MVGLNNIYIIYIYIYIYIYILFMEKTINILIKIFPLLPLSLHVYRERDRRTDRQTERQREKLKTMQQYLHLSIFHTTLYLTIQKINTINFNTINH